MPDNNQLPNRNNNRRQQATFRSGIPRLPLYGAITTALTCTVIASTVSKYPHYYTAMLYLAKSNTSMLVLANMSLLLIILFCKLMFRLFFGTLRAIEVEHLYERGWFSVTEMCLALTIFRDESNILMAEMFAALLVVKIFHWLLEDRVDFMEQQLMLSWWMVGQLVALTLLLGVVDGGMIYYAVSVTKAVGASMMIVFGFEYALQAVDLFGSAVKCALNVVDVRMDHEWEEKSSYVFYLELLSDTIKLGVYISFVYHLINSYGPPIHILRDVYLTARSFYDKCRDWMRYRQAMRNMNQKYQTVSQEQLSQLSDTTCIICREDMEGPTEETIRRWQNQQRLGVPVHVPGSTPKRLPCGHIFHFNCLRGWLERQQACPTCRRSVLVDHVPQASSNTAADPHRTAGRDEGRATSSQVPATTAAGDAASGDHSWQRGARSEDATPPGAETTFASPHWRGPRQQHQQQGSVGAPTIFNLPRPTAAQPFIPEIFSPTHLRGSSSVDDDSERHPHPARPINGTGCWPDAGTSSHDLAISLVSRMFPGAKLIPLAPSPTSDLPESSGQPSNSNGNTTSISSSNIDPISGFLSSRSSVQQLPLDSFPLPDLSKLSDAQLHDLETNTRRGIEGRLRVLAAAQHHLDLVARLLTRVQSVLPEASLGETKAGTENSSSGDTTGHTSSGDIRSTDKGKQAASSLPNEGSDTSDI